MFQEIISTRQNIGQPKRRWFASKNMDLFVWYDSDNKIISYQITYDKPQAEKALTWNIDSSFSHLGVDDGSHPGKHPGSPLLVADGALNLPRLIYLINRNFGEMEPEIKNFIIAGIVKKFAPSLNV